MWTLLRFPRVGDTSRSDTTGAALDEKFGFTARYADAGIRSAAEVAELLDFWHPDACAVNNDSLPAEAFDGYPTVFFHRAAELGNPLHCAISLDEKAMAETAARHLLSLNLSSYAYVPPRDDEQWSLARERHFVRILGLSGYEVASYVHPRGRLSAPKRVAHLGGWLRGLPRPAGIFAANDNVAAAVIAACDHEGLAIPNDIALLGADNDETVCETSRPMLSSIAIDSMASRVESLRILSQLITGKGQAQRRVAIRPLGVVRRASTLRMEKNDPAVVAACELIRRRACDGLKARDVAATFPCGRRMAEIRFRAMIGHSILEEIRAVRRERARLAVTPFRTQLRDEIAALCGYSSWSSVQRLLKGGEPGAVKKLRS